MTTNQIVIFVPPDSSTLLWHCNITIHIAILPVLQEHQKTSPDNIKRHFALKM